MAKPEHDYDGSMDSCEPEEGTFRYAFPPPTEGYVENHGKASNEQNCLHQTPPLSFFIV